MIAILVHFLGCLVLNSAIPPYVDAVDADFLMKWYAAFAALDLMALSLGRGSIRAILTLSFAWSCALAVEQAMLLDNLQRYDWIAQYAIDGTLIVIFSYTIARAARASTQHRFIP